MLGFIIFIGILILWFGISLIPAYFMVKHRCMFAKKMKIGHESQEKIEDLKEQAKNILESGSLNVNAPCISVKKNNAGIEWVEVANEKVKVKYYSADDNNINKYQVEHLVESEKSAIFRVTINCMLVVFVIMVILYFIFCIKNLA